MIPYRRFDSFDQRSFLPFSQPLRLRMTITLNNHLQHRFSTLYPRRGGPAVLLQEPKSAFFSRLSFATDKHEAW
jgi:hypothetical protein